MRGDETSPDYAVGSSFAAKAKKLAQKEKSVYEMIDMLNEKLDKKMDKFTRRDDYCREDLNPDSTLTYKELKEIEKTELNDGIEESLAGGRRRDSIIFSGSAGVGGYHSMEEERNRLSREYEVPDPSRLTWRDPQNAQTDAGRRLEGTFTAFLHAESRSNRKAKGVGGTQKLSKKLEERKRDRKDMERILYANSDHHSSRAANNLRYELPEAVAASVKAEVNRGEGSVRVGGEITTVIGDDGEGLETTVGTSLTQTEASRVRFAFDAKYADPYSSCEKWPIPLADQHHPYDMKPGLLLELACEKMSLSDGELVLKKLCINRMARSMYVYMHWYVHCRFFQDNSEVEQQYLLSKVAAIYTTMLGSRNLEANKDFFFTHFPFVLGQAIILGFKYLCPGNQSLFTSSFKKILYLTMVQLLSGVDVCPESVTSVRHSMFPEDGTMEEGEGNTLPALPFGQGEGRDPAGVGGPMGATMPQVGKGGLAYDGEEEFGAGRGFDEHQMSSLLFGGEAGDGVERGADTVNLLQMGLPKYVYGQGREEGKKEEREGRKTRLRPLKSTFTIPTFPDHALYPPVSKFTGTRSTLKFHPAKPKALGRKSLPRQKQTTFDASGISPLLQQYLDHHSDTGGRRPQSLKRTEPVRWCRTGGVDTFHRIKVGRETTRDLITEYRKAKERNRSEAASEMKEYVRERNKITVEAKKVRKKGMESVAKKAIEVMKETQGRKGGGKKKEEVEGGETSVFRKLKVHNM